MKKNIRKVQGLLLYKLQYFSGISILYRIFSYFWLLSGCLFCLSFYFKFNMVLSAVFLYFLFYIFLFFMIWFIFYRYIFFYEKKYNVSFKLKLIPHFLLFIIFIIISSIHAWTYEAHLSFNPLCHMYISEIFEECTNYSFSTLNDLMGENYNYGRMTEEQGGANNLQKESYYTKKIFFKRFYTKPEVYNYLNLNYAGKPLLLK